ncbi:NAD(P)/FAD-dependent oxidoreductase [Pseudooceanicola sp. CBS1P-1]|uniref:SidA/IucD/PvdA family monooxygenase n=1 Tax=Pseudooceanicola albus TaxID=2692189 RepID=A0A6L7G8B1_9RHOB|nr:MULTISPECIES: NAD(P)/FAD-dependent oxidoreductase [Pseudooceanicola]MBT9385923.1 NAD(P)/FAD-dependent oxidoreductase [Pseudooceanicola endophyticus]MXN19656.1 SidA/IucD/PvdA family monooxygenase [Pseudooceanicola albus]
MSQQGKEADCPALSALEARIPVELEQVQALPDPWIDGASGQVPVVICGAGMSGLGLAFALRRAGVADVRVIDARPAGREGPWITSARMKTLRSPKHLSSLDLGIPSLTMRAWYEARYGAPAWAALERPSKEDWMRYLLWFRRVSGIAVQNDTRLCAIAPAQGGLRLTLEGPEGVTQLGAARLVLATGLDGGGGPHVPPEVARALPRARYTHSAEEAEDGRLKGLRVAVLGGQTSAFDWSVTALEQGAAQVVQFGREAHLPRTEALAWMAFPGFMTSFPDLPPEVRFRFMQQYFRCKIPPTQDQYDRAIGDPAFRYLPGSGTCRFAMEGAQIRIANAHGTFHADHLLLGTGYRYDPALRPELHSLQGLFTTWGTRLPEAAADPFIAAHPYLGPGFELLPQAPGADWITRVHLYNAAALPSLGPISNGITGFRYGVPRLVRALVTGLFAARADAFLSAFEAFEAPHFDPRPPRERSA